MSEGILIVAPDSDLNTVADLLAAAQGFRVNVLKGFVTGREALKEIASGRYQIVHFAGHGAVDGLRASDGPLDDEYLEMALRSSAVELVVLNTCSSVAIAAKLYRAGVVPRAISWRVEVTDPDATAWAAAFYAALALGADYWEAYLSSVEVMQTRSPGFEPPVYLNGRIALLEQQVMAIQARLDGLHGAVVVSRRVVVTAALVFLAALLLTFHAFIAPHLQEFVR